MKSIYLNCKCGVKDNCWVLNNTIKCVHCKEEYDISKLFINDECEDYVEYTPIEALALKREEIKGICDTVAKISMKDLENVLTLSEECSEATYFGLIKICDLLSKIKDNNISNVDIKIV